MSDDNEQPVAPVVDLFRKPTVEDGDLEDAFDLELRADDDVEISDLAFIARRLMVRTLTYMDWDEVGNLAAAMVDDDDVRIVKQFMANAKIDVTIAGF